MTSRALLHSCVLYHCATTAAQETNLDFRLEVVDGDQQLVGLVAGPISLLFEVDATHLEPDFGLRQLLVGRVDLGQLDRELRDVGFETSDD